MVDSVGAKPVTRDVGIARVAAASPIAAVQAAATPAATTQTATASPTTALSGVAQTMSASAPVDTDRVAKIKKAIQDGKFPILPATIADRMIALKLQWNPNEAA